MMQQKGSGFEKRYTGSSVAAESTPMRPPLPDKNACIRGHILDCELAELHSSCELFPQFIKQDVTPLSFRSRQHRSNGELTPSRFGTNVPLYNISFEFPADGCMMSVDPSGNLSKGKTGTRYMTDDISLIFCKMGIGHGRLLLGVRLVVLPTLPEILSCPPVILCGAL